MSDFERTFGAGADAASIIEEFSKMERNRYKSVKQQIFEKEKKKFDRALIQLGFKWCLKHHVIDFPKLSPKAVFLDRVDDNQISRLIIDPQRNHIDIKLINSSQFEFATYMISQKNAFHNATLIAMDFKFSSRYPYINLNSFIEERDYRPMQIIM